MENSISGIAIYNESATEERLEFVWYRTEENVPLKELNILIEKIIAKKWHNGDKISKHLEKMEFEEFDNTTKENILDELLKVDIKMVDDGEETDSYFVHH